MKVMPSAEFAAGLHHVVEIDVVLDLERRGLVVADHAGAAGHGRDVADRLLGRVGGGRVRRGGIGRGRAGAAGCEGSVCACASCVRLGRASRSSVVPIVALQANSSSAKESWRDIGDFRSRGRQKAGPDFSAVRLNAG